MEEYDIYYDECKKDGYWHGLLFVPVYTQNQLLSYLSMARKNYSFPYPIHFINVGANDLLDKPRTKLTRSFISIGCASLQQQKFQKKPKAYIGDTPTIINSIKAKFAIYKVEKETMRVADRASLIEGSLKSSLKGSFHFLFNNPLTVRRIIFEGKDLQGISDVSIMSRLRTQVKDNIVSIPERFICQISDHTKIADEPMAKDCHLLQLCDALVGAVRYCVTDNTPNNARHLISCPALEILKYADEPHVRMKQSRYYRGFSLTQAKLENNSWAFEPLRQRKSNPDIEQLKLPF